MADYLRGLFKTYLAYLPALLTFTGAVWIAFGIFVVFVLPGEQAQSNWLRLAGAGVAALGAFWAGHRQITSSAANAERDQKLLEA